LKCGGSTPLWIFGWAVGYRKNPNIQSGVGLGLFELTADV
jgi:hypothetical protein